MFLFPFLPSGLRACSRCLLHSGLCLLLSTFPFGVLMMSYSTPPRLIGRHLRSHFVDRNTNSEGWRTCSRWWVRDGPKASIWTLTINLGFPCQFLNRVRKEKTFSSVVIKLVLESPCLNTRPLLHVFLFIGLLYKKATCDVHSFWSREMELSLMNKWRKWC